ncbi:methylenetetrahydrofolate reductase C-terminal domain-containing protein [Acinetobacter celticus]|uniref:Methylenetetrahydrofolate reductase n=1 Tax=Acinetobacter celticus TaxID=1891224 RepID=A0A1C3CUL3_9GAMM|nr:methylenetetrahydrofolate reductase C-terminal domain-containing protein [Acinetobacter celticus]ODA12421.1 methylenetetrahydrofolate reductase [Acinetobacter celticus]
MSLFIDSLKAQNFCVLVEYLCTMKVALPVRSSLAGYPVYMTWADRVQTDEDPSPLDVAQNAPEGTEQVLHYSGKGRDIANFEQFLKQAKALGLRNLLLLSGDKLKNHNDGHLQPELRSRYLESVNMVMAARRDPSLNIGVAFNPFKYAEAERDAQYFKLQKKIQAGADYIITQLGFDLDALKQAKKFLESVHIQRPILACVMPLTLARANFMVKHKVAGIVITPHMLNVLAEEKETGFTERVYLRCALQILICKQLGFAGIHLSACHKAEEQMRLERYLEEYGHLELDALELLWNSFWQVKTGKEFMPTLTSYSRQPTSSQIIKYQHLHFMHDAFFESKIAKGVGKLIFKAQFWEQATVAKALLKTEFVSKHGVVGCESCGQCRLGDTLYICPETCPKGLANGPCGGTTLDRCEFGDRECIHSVKARLAKAVDQTIVLKEKLIPTVPIEIRGTSSWKNWYV